jgi:hypothetical protein
MLVYVWRNQQDEIAGELSSMKQAQLLGHGLLALAMEAEAERWDVGKYQGIKG